MSYERGITNFNRAFGYGKSAKPSAVTLSCGHVITLRTGPIHRESKYPCNHNLGCGYQLHWVKSVCDGFVVDNPNHPEVEKRETDDQTQS